MTMQQKSRFCPLCQRPTLHTRNTFSGWIGLLLTIITAGLFLPIWFLIVLWGMLADRFRCQTCGR